MILIKSWFELIWFSIQNSSLLYSRFFHIIMTTLSEYFFKCIKVMNLCLYWCFMLPCKYLPLTSNKRKYEFSPFVIVFHLSFVYMKKSRFKNKRVSFKMSIYELNSLYWIREVLSLILLFIFHKCYFHLDVL